MGYTILDDCFKPFCYDVLLCELKIESLGDEMTLVYKGHSFDDMVKAIEENRDLKREIELLQGQVSYYQDKVEENEYSDLTITDLEEECECLRIAYKKLMDSDKGYWEEKYEDACNTAKKIISENESLRKENKALQANIDILKKNVRLKEVEKRDKLIDDVFDMIYEFYEDAHCGV